MAKFLCIALALCALGSAQGQFADIASGLLRGGGSRGFDGLAGLGVDAITSRLTGSRDSGSGIADRFSNLDAGALTSRLIGGGSGLTDLVGGFVRRGRAIPDAATLARQAIGATQQFPGTVANAAGSLGSIFQRRTRAVPNFNGFLPFGIPKIDDIRNTFDNVQEHAKAALNNGGKAVKNVFVDFNELTDDAQDFIGNAAKKFFNHGTAGQATEAVNSFADVAKNVADQATDAVSAATDVADNVNVAL